MTVSDQTYSEEPKPKGRSSLVRLVVIVMLAMALFPILIIGAAAYGRSNEVVREQTQVELTQAGNNIYRQLLTLKTAQDKALEAIRQQTGFIPDVKLVISEARYDPNFTIAFLRLKGYFQNNSVGPFEPIFDKIFLVDTNGKVHVTTDLTFIDSNVSEDPLFQKLLSEDQSVIWFNPAPYYPNRLAIATSQAVVNENGSRIATLVGIAVPRLPVNLLATFSIFSPNARGYFFTANNQMVTADKESLQAIQISAQPDQKEKLLKRIQSYPEGGTEQFDSYNGKPVLAYLKWYQDLNAGLVIEIPADEVVAQVQIFTPYNTILLAILLFISGLIVYLAGIQLVNPINQLSQKALAFASGDFSQRADESRKDEIGLLAQSFNKMVEEISTLYRSMEQKVEDRTLQMRTASEIAQAAISSTNREDILYRTVQLLTERFDFNYAAIYLLDETGTSLVLKGASQKGEEEISFRELRLPLISQNILTWVAANNKTRIVSDLSDESGNLDHLIPGARSELAVPIILEDQLLGVLDIQSSRPASFDADTAGVFRALTSQVAVGLRNVDTLESTEINLQETTLLYRASRQITQSKDEIEIAEILAATLSQTPYVSFLLAIEPDHLRLLTLTDSRGGKSDSAYKGIRLPLQKGSAHLEEGAITIINNLKAPSEFDNLLSFFDRRGCTSAALIPILEGGRAAKILALGSRSATPLSMTALQPFANLAEVIGTTYERFNVLRTLRLRLNELQTLASVSEAISSQTDLLALYQTLHHKIQEAVGGEVGFVLATYNAAENMVDIPYIYEGGEVSRVAPFPLGEGLTSYVIRECKPLLLSGDIERSAADLGVKIVGQPARSWLGIPLMVGGSVIGALVIQDAEQEDRFGQAELDLLNTLAPQIATSIRNAQLLEEMQKALSAYDQERFLLNSLMDNTPDQIYFKDQTGTYLRVSNSMVNALGLNSPADIINHNDYELFGEEAGEASYQELEYLLQQGEPKEEVVETVSEDGQTTFWNQVTQIPLFTEDEQPYGILGIQRDITGLKIAENIAQQRAQQVRTAAEIARDTSGTLDLSELLQKSVNLVRERYGFYHASVFLLDAIGEYAVLEESTGEAGARMKGAGHKLAVGSQSIVGQTTATGVPLVVNDVRQDPTYYPNPLLPETRSEAAIPLKVGDQIIGALDVQSRRVNAFSEEDISTLQILADQVAVAVTNANLFTRTQEQISKHRMLHQITSAASSSDTVQEALEKAVHGLHLALGNDRIGLFIARPDGLLEMRYHAGYIELGEEPITVQSGEGIVGQVALNRRAMLVRDSQAEPQYIPIDPNVRSELAVPVVYRDELIGVLNLESVEPAAYDESDTEIMTSLVANLASVLSNLQLLGQIRQQVERQRQIFEITSKIRQSVDIQTILETSASELAKALKARRAAIQVTTDIIEKPMTSDLSGKNNGKERLS